MEYKVPGGTVIGLVEELVKANPIEENVQKAEESAAKEPVKAKTTPNKTRTKKAQEAK